MNFSHFRRGILFASAFVVPSLNLSGVGQAEEFTLKEKVDFMNGAQGRVIGPDDVLIVTESGGISVDSSSPTKRRAVDLSGSRSKLTNAGLLEAASDRVEEAVVLSETGQLLDNKGKIENKRAASPRTNIAIMADSVLGQRTRDKEDNILGDVKIINRKGGAITAEGAGITEAVTIGKKSSFVNEKGGSVTAITHGDAGENVYAHAVRIGRTGRDDVVTAEEASTLENAGSISVLGKKVGQGAAHRSMASAIQANILSYITNTGDISGTMEKGTLTLVEFTRKANGSRFINEATGVLDGKSTETTVAVPNVIKGINIDVGQDEIHITNNGTINLGAIGPEDNVEGIKSAGSKTRILLAQGSKLIANSAEGRAGGITLTAEAEESSVDISGYLKVTGGGAKEAIGLKSEAPGLDVVVRQSGVVGVVQNGHNGGAGGIILSGEKATIFVAGEVSAEGNSNVGDVLGISMDSKDGRVVIQDSGRVTVTKSGGGTVFGINIRGNKAQVENKGLVQLSLKGVGDNIAAGKTGAAIQLGVADAQLINLGQISSELSGVNIAENASIINKGTIQSSGKGGCVICSSPGKKLTLVNSGTILGALGSTQANEQAAIKLQSAGDLTFNPGSFLIGKIVLEGNGHQVTIDGRGRSSRWQFSGKGSILGGKPTVKIAEGQAVFYNSTGRDVMIVDNVALNKNVANVSTISQNVSSALRSQRFEMLNKPTSAVWGAWQGIWNGEGANSDAGDDDEKELVVGVHGISGDWIIGALGGYAIGAKKIFDSAGLLSLENNISGPLGGLYAVGKMKEGAFIQGALFGGIIDQSDVRYMTDHMVESGLQKAKSSYGSYWLSPEVTAGFILKSSNGFILTPSAQVSYGYASIPMRKETGVLQPLVYGRQDISLASARVEVEFARQFGNVSAAAFGGYQYISSLSDAAVSVTNIAQKAELTPDNLLRQGVYGGLNMLVSLPQSVNLSLGGRVSYDENNNSKMNMQLTAGISSNF